MPKWGEGEVYDQTLAADLSPEGQARQGTGLTKGQILWLRGITRLQTQVCKSKKIILVGVGFKVNFFLTLKSKKKKKKTSCT
jgi:hypothetical protein